MILLIAFAVLSIGFSFLCSILEASLLSITPSYIASQKQDKPELFSRLRGLKDDIDDPLAAILTLNTIAHTAGATGVGAQTAVVFGEAWVGVASGIMTLAILIVSEIIPKTIGATYWRAIAPKLPTVLGFLMTSLRPFVWLAKQITRRIATTEDQTDVRSEISALVEIGRDEEVVDEDEWRVILNVLRFHEIKINTIMTPRTVSRIVAPNCTMEEFKGVATAAPFSRIPVIDKDDHAYGYIHKADLINLSADGDLMDLVRPIKQVNGADNVELVFSEMLKERQHLAVVYDDLGTWLGLVTVEDILETLLGTEIMDETDKVSDLRRYARQRWTRKLRRPAS